MNPLLERRIEALAAVLELLEHDLGIPRSAKAAAILAGAPSADSYADSFGDNYRGKPFLKALVDARRGDPESNEYIKAVLGTSNATGLSIVPNNFVAEVAQRTSAGNVYRQICNVVTGINGAAVDIPYEADEISAALLQGAYGSNKDVRDFTFGEVTATLYTIAQIADIGNQLLRQSNGAAEAVARRRLAKSFAKAEATFITNGTGTNQPRGIFTAFGDYGGTACNTALNSEARAATIGRALGALEARGQTATAVVMHPTDYWELATETLGSGAGGWAFDAATGPSGGPTLSLWGIPVYRDPHWPAAKVGTALVGNFAEIDVYFGQEYRNDVSSEAGTRFDQNITGFRAEEEMAFDARPYVFTGKLQQVTGL